MKSGVPEIVKVAKRTVLTVTMKGTPDHVFPTVMPALYGTAYGTKFKVFKPKRKKMVIGKIVSSYPNALRAAVKNWIITTDLEVSDFVQAKDLLQKDPQRPVKVGKRPAATYAQILHIGSYATEAKNVKTLMQFIRTQKLKLAGPHEEVYLTMPGPKAKTIIRHRVKAS